MKIYGNGFLIPKRRMDYFFLNDDITGFRQSFTTKNYRKRLFAHISKSNVFLH